MYFQYDRAARCSSQAADGPMIVNYGWQFYNALIRSSAATVFS